MRKLNKSLFVFLEENQGDEKKSPKEPIRC